ncbi:MAG: DUF3267 domain-containing protein [Saprospiraceae bacterium]|nr:DUF3267 domain-containing protein [Saprospiraceae bacterium]
MKFGDCVSYLSFGIIFAFLLILVHEYIHVLAYKSQGANRTSYDSNWKKLYFMALADKFVANKKEFSIVALAPFVVINSILILGLFLVKGLWCFTILGTLMMSIHPDYHPKMKKDISSFLVWIILSVDTNGVIANWVSMSFSIFSWE